MLRAFLINTPKTGANLNTLHRVNAHQRMSQVRVQPVENRLTQAGRNALSDHIDTRTDGIALFAQGIHIGFHLRHLIGIRAEKRILVNLIPIDLLNADWSQLGEITPDRDAKTLLQKLPRDGTGGDPHRCLARRRSTSTPIIPNTVLVHVGIVGVGRTELLRDLRIIL